MIHNKKYSVVAIGNAMLDLICEVPEQFLDEEGISKGAMNLVSMERSNSILKLVGIDVHSFAVAGAFILLFIALEMILGITLYKQEDDSDLSATVFPLAFPLIAGPGSLTTLLSLKSEFYTENIIYINSLLNHLRISNRISFCRYCFFCLCS